MGRSLQDLSEPPGFLTNLFVLVPLLHQVTEPECDTVYDESLWFTSEGLNSTHEIHFLLHRLPLGRT